MKRKNKFLTGIAALVLLLALVTGMAGPSLVRALWDKGRAVHIDPDKIENSTLIIGSHLIHLSAMTDQIYEVAEKSAQDSGQMELYYKSELAGGAWMEITSASQLSDITSSDKTVESKVIKELFFTHHTKSDKKTYDLRTGKEVSVFNILDPYDKEVLDELMPLKMHYDMVLERDGNCDLTDRIEKVFDTEIESAQAGDELLVTETIDEEMNALQGYLDELTQNEASAIQIDKVNDAMEKLDASRRYVVMANLETALNEYLDELNKTSDEKDDGNSKTELTAALSEALKNVQASEILHEGKFLTKGTTVASEAAYNYTKSLIEHAVANDHKACDGDVENLIDLEHIQDDTVAERARELAILENDLIPKADERYRNELKHGENAEYKAEKEKKSSQVVLDKIIRNSASKTDGARGELEFFIEAKCNRLEHKMGIEFLGNRLNMIAADFSAVIPADGFKESCDISLQKHRDYLTQKQRALELATGGNEMDKLTLEKQKLQDQKRSADDKNDKAGSDKLADQISELEAKIRQLEQELAQKSKAAAEKVRELEKQLKENPDSKDLQQQLNAAKNDLDTLNNSGSDGSLGRAVARLQKQAKDGISGMDGIGGSGDGTGGTGGTGSSGTGTSEGSAAAESAAEAINALAELLPIDPGLVAPALQDVFETLQAKDQNSPLLGVLENAIQSNPNALIAGLNEDKLKGFINRFLTENFHGMSMEDMSGRGAATVLLALQKFYDQTKNAVALRMIGTIANKMYNSGNDLIYDRINATNGPYLPLHAVQAITGRRLVWNQNTSCGTLGKGNDYYSFTLYSDQVLRDREGNKTELMERPAQNMSGLHIPGEYAQTAFQVWPVYLSQTELGLVCDQPMDDLANELLDLFSAEAARG